LLACLRTSPDSLEELSHGLTLTARQVAPIVKELLDAGAIVRLKGRDDEGRAIYALAGYVEASKRLDNSDLDLGMDYSGQYEAPIWRDDA
jgi:predicted transcriptional regulator